ncbi:MAG: histidine ammonia-lyase [Promethearchaeati archaeon]
MNENQVFKYGIDRLNVDLTLKIVNKRLKGILVEEVKNKIIKSYQAIEKIVQGEKLVYSVNTGIGSLCRERISKEETRKLSKNLLKSHSVGVGNVIEKKIAKLMLITKVHTLCFGYSGVSLDVIERIMWHIDHDVIPYVPKQGSVGASGDLAPLAHLFLPLIGLGSVSDNGEDYKETNEILDKYGLNPIELQAKEGLALINGTQFMEAFSILIAEKLQNCLDHADLIGALTLEGYLGSTQPFNEDLIKLRPHPGAIKVAKNFRLLLKDSDIVESHKNCTRVQDPYSIRCIPQVHGAARDALKHFTEILERELNSVTDNPIIFDEDTALSGGNFHGEPIALPLDYIGLAASELGNISDRRTYLLLEGKWDLPMYLIEHSGFNTGFMIAQYTTASLVSENKTYCFPASADSIPTSMGQEDHVSMGSISARKTLKIIKNLEKILAIELICACQALDFRSPLKTTPSLEKVHKYVRKSIPHLNKDVLLSNLIENAIDLIRSNELLGLINLN